MNAYGAWQLTAVLAASVITFTAIARGRLLGWRSIIAISVACLGGLVGARLMKVAFHLTEARGDPTLIWSWDFRGLDLAGVLLGGALAGGLVAFLLRLPIARLANTAVPGLAVGMSLSKVGCWVVGCCFGRVYDGIGAVKVARFSDAHLAEIGAGMVSPLGDPVSVFPIQILEMMIPLVALVCWLGFMIGQPGWRASREAKGALVFLAAYGVLKALVTLGRFPDAAGDPPVMHLALYLTPIAVLLWVAATQRAKPQTCAVEPK